MAQVKITTSAPTGDCFYVLVQYFALNQGGSTRLRVTMKVRRLLGAVQGADMHALCACAVGGGVSRVFATDVYAPRLSCQALAA